MIQYFILYALVFKLHPTFGGGSQFWRPGTLVEHTFTKNRSEVRYGPIYWHQKIGSSGCLVNVLILIPFVWLHLVDNCAPYNTPTYYSLCYEKNYSHCQNFHDSELFNGVDNSFDVIHSNNKCAVMTMIRYSKCSYYNLLNSNWVLEL